MEQLLFNTINWDAIEKVAYKGTTGMATWQTKQYASFRIRLVEYSANYLADHWCQKGHIVYCIKGSFTSELENEDPHILQEGMMYVVSDDASSHRSVTKDGATLLIIDGDFLKTT